MERNYSKTFSKLDEALQYANFMSNGETIVAAFQITLGGQRKYIVTSFKHFWNFYIKLSNKKFYEVIQSDRPVKLYFDVEFMKLENPKMDGYLLTEKLIELVNLHLREKYNCENSFNDVMVLESTTEQKFSIHLIFVGTIFRSIQNVRKFVTQFLKIVNENHRGIFEVQKKNKTVSFVDVSVYSEKQNFRMFLSEKLGKSNPLLVSKMDRFTSRLVPNCQSEKFVLQQEIFFSSLITNVKGHQTSYVEDGGEEDYFSTSERRTHADSMSLTASCRASSSLSLSPYPEVDNFITDLVKPDGFIRSWKYFKDSNMFTFTIGNNKYCQNVRRHHTNNHVYYTLCLKTLSVKQRCFSCVDFESDPIYVETLKWLETLDSWD